MSLPPSGEIPQGAIRFNTDSQKLEFYAQGEWWVMSTDTPNLGTSSSDSTPGVRGIIVGGYTHPSATDRIDYINIASTGNAIDFGNLTGNAGQSGAVASTTRGVRIGGESPSNVDVIDFITMASTGNATDFGDCINSGRSDSCASNATRGLKLANITNNQIEYITISSSGVNAQDFGDNSTARAQTAALASPTRAVSIGGYTTPGGAYTNTIDYVTITTLGDSIDFGDDVGTRAGGRGFSNAIRGVFGGGFNPTPYASDINYLTIASKGNAVSFGSLSAGSRYGSAECSSTRGIFNIGDIGPATSNIIEFIQISTQGDAVDFGDATASGYQGAGLSNGHGGL